MSVTGTITTAASVNISTNSGAVGFLGQSSNFIGWSGRSRFKSSADGNITLFNAAETGFSALLFGGTTSAFPAVRRSGAGLIFRLADDSADATTTMAAINVSSTTLSSYFAGSVGIGSTTPSAKLSVHAVSGDTNTNVFMIASSTLNGAATSTLFSVLASGRVGIGTSTPQSTFDVWGNLNVGSTRESTLAVVTNQVTVNNLDGQPGYNTNAELQVFGSASSQGDIALVRGDTTTTAGETLGTVSFASLDSFLTNLASIRAVASEIFTGSTAGTYMEFLTHPTGNAATAVRMRIEADGNVGIGSTTPLSTLSVSGTAGTNPFTVASSTGNSFFTVVSTGSVGIGTTTPGGKFSITGTAGTGDVVRIASSTNVGAFLSVKSSGNVGIGTDAPQQALHVYRSTDGPPVRFEDSNGYCEIDPTSTSWVCTSDRNLKKDIANISTEDSLSRIAKLQSVSFKWKTQETDDLRYGLIAQDVEAIFPELVTTAENGIKSVAYGGFTPFIIEAIKALNMSVEDLKTRVASVEGRISAVESLLGTAVVGSTTVETATSTTLGMVSEWFSSMGVAIENGIARFTSVFADKVNTKELTVGNTSNFAAAGITVLDRATGQPACMYVENGVITSRPGDCGAVTGVGNATNSDTNTNTGDNVSPSVDETATTTDPVIEEVATTTEEVATTTEPEPAPETVPETVETVVETVAEN